MCAQGKRCASSHVRVDATSGDNGGITWVDSTDELERVRVLSAKGVTLPTYTSALGGARKLESERALKSIDRRVLSSCEGLTSGVVHCGSLVNAPLGRLSYPLGAVEP